jgi:DNA replication protein DnaC
MSTRIIEHPNCEKFRCGWNAPKRHVDFIPPKPPTTYDQTIWTEKLHALQDQQGNGFMVALVGGRGNGKTQIGVELMRRATRDGFSAYYTTTTEVFMRIKDSYQPRESETEAQIVKDLVSYQCLVVDEFGKRGESRWENNMLFLVLDKRYNATGLDTLLIDNRSQVEFEKAAGPSLCSRMNETGGIIECNWGSFRK